MAGNTTGRWIAISAFERLQARAAKAAEAAAEAEAEEARLKEEERELKRARRYDGARQTDSGGSRRSSRSDSVATAFGKSLARQLGTRTGRAIVRGILGSLFKSR